MTTSLIRVTFNYLVMDTALYSLISVSQELIAGLIFSHIAFRRFFNHRGSIFRGQFLAALLFNIGTSMARDSVPMIDPARLTSKPRTFLTSSFSYYCITGKWHCAVRWRFGPSWI